MFFIKEYGNHLSIEDIKNLFYQKYKGLLTPNYKFSKYMYKPKIVELWTALDCDIHYLKNLASNGTDKNIK